MSYRLNRADYFARVATATKGCRPAGVSTAGEHPATTCADSTDLITVPAATKHQ